MVGGRGTRSVAKVVAKTLVGFIIDWHKGRGGRIRIPGLLMLRQRYTDQRR